MKEKWLIESKKADFDHIAKKFNISPIVARVIRNRNIIGDEAIDEYLNGTLESISSPWLFKDMDKAVDVLKIKLAEDSKIRIIGDYDVDGICASHILHVALEKLGANVDVEIPNRVEDGYGINERLIDSAKSAGIDTIITCDNGIAASESINHAKSLGMTVIVTDHHEIPFEDTEDGRVYTIPDADAVIDQKLEDCAYPFKEVCGAVVAWQFMRALYESMGKGLNELDNLLSYAAMATVCDVVDLIGENRTIVKAGLEKIHNTKDIGLSALIEACQIDKKNIDGYHFGFILGPCLNASGRLDTAKKAVELLNEKDESLAMSDAISLKKLNDSRKEITENNTKEALAIAEGNEDKVLIIHLPECHESIVGIVAGRVREAYNKPTIIVTDTEDGMKGSGRSIEEYNMFEELSNVKDLFTKFGGHKMAAGLSLDAKNFDEFKRRLNENCTLTEDDLDLKVMIDVQLPFEYVTMNLVDELELIKPFGKSNSKPVFAEKEVKLHTMRIVGKNKNVVQMTLENKNHYKIKAVKFNDVSNFLDSLKEKIGTEAFSKAVSGEPLDVEIMITYYPTTNVYNGMSNIQLVVDRVQF